MYQPSWGDTRAGLPLTIRYRRSGIERRCLSLEKRDTPYNSETPQGGQAATAPPKLPGGRTGRPITRAVRLTGPATCSLQGTELSAHRIRVQFALPYMCSPVGGAWSSPLIPGGV